MKKGRPRYDENGSNAVIEARRICEIVQKLAPRKLAELIGLEDTKLFKTRGKPPAVTQIRVRRFMDAGGYKVLSHLELAAARLEIAGRIINEQSKP